MWHAKARYDYDKTDTEAYDNAVEIWNILGSLGWTLNAVSGFLGNQAWEGGYNPWRWEGDNVIASTDTTHIDNPRGNGYGLVQFTPASKYLWDTRAQADADFAPNYSDVAGQPHDGASQIRFIDQYADYYPTSGYPLTYSQFKASTQTPQYLAGAWLYNYERPGDPSATIALRQAEAYYWYQVLQGLPPTPPTPTSSSKFKWWLYLRRRF